MKLKIFLLLTIFWTKASIGQVDSLRYYVDKLNWNAFREINNYFPKLALTDTLNRVVQIQDSSKINLLFKELKKSNKTVAVHIVLTLIFNPSYVGFGRKEETGRNSTTVYFFNGLTWERNYKQNVSGSGKVKKKDIEAIIKYWKQRIYQK